MLPYHCAIAAIFAESLSEDSKKFAVSALVLRLLMEVDDIDFLRKVKSAYENDEREAVVLAGKSFSSVYDPAATVLFNALMILGPLLFTAQLPITSAKDLLIGGAIVTDTLVTYGISRLVARQRLYELICSGKNALLHGKKTVRSLGGDPKKQKING